MDKNFRVTNSGLKMRPDQPGSLKPRDRFWMLSIVLVLLVCAAVMGVLTGLSPALMIAVAAVALAAWDLVGKVLNRRDSGKLPSLILPKWVHIRLLGAAVGLGLLLAEVGLYVQLALPFSVVILAAGMILFGLFSFYRLINR